MQCYLYTAFCYYLVFSSARNTAGMYGGKYVQKGESIPSWPDKYRVLELLFRK